MNITRLAIKNNRLTAVILFVVVALGIQTFFTMPRAYDPGFIVRAAQVVTHFPGASPERVEQLVSSQLEEVIKEIPELDFVTSESRTGISIVSVNIKESYTDMRPIWDNLRRKMQDIETDLPDGALGPYVNDEFGDVYGIVLSITGEGFNYSELNNIAEEIRDELQLLPEVSKVEVHGAQEERVFVQYNNTQLAELGVSPEQLSQSMKKRNIVIPGGSFVLGDERIALEPSGNFESIADIEQTILQLPNTDKILYLRDIAKISRGYVDPPNSSVHSSGVRALGIAVSMRDGGNNVLLGKQVNEALDRFIGAYPHGIEFDIINFSPEEVDKKIGDFVSSLLQAILVVTIVMLVSLGIRTGLIVSILIPVAMLLAIIIMSALDIGIDQVSLVALIIALGMLVDNGIVMSENIMVQMEKGKSVYNAAIDSTSELQFPLLTASLTTAAAFLPIFLAESAVGEFTASLFKVVTITLLSSWVISLTVIPMLCVYFLKIEPKTNNYNNIFYTNYQKLLSLLLRNKTITLVITSAIFFIVMKGFASLPQMFFPPSDRPYFTVTLELPSGTSIQKTASVVTDIENHIKRELEVNNERTEGIVNWVSYIGNAGPRYILSHNPKPTREGYAFMIINATSASEISRLMKNISQYTMDHHPDLDIKPRLIGHGPGVENPVEIRLSSSDTDLLFTQVNALKQEMNRIGGLKNISDNWGQRIKKLEIRIDQPRALRSGVTSQDIAISLQAGLSGLELTEYRERDDIIPVMLRSEASNQSDISVLEALSVYVQASGKSIPLTQVADIHLNWDAAKIYRRNGLKTVTISSQLEDGAVASEKFVELLPWLEERQKSWGFSVRYDLGGEDESSSNANQSIADKLPLAGLIILALLIAQFNSIRKAVIILTTIPLGLIGVVIGLNAAQSYLGFMTYLGIISLAGIVINNAIVLLERIKIEIDSGKQHQQAILSAAQQRARPIILTTTTTVFGLLPLYFGSGAMWESMAIAIISGLIFSTLLTLCVIPVIYATLFNVKY